MKTLQRPPIFTFRDGIQVGIEYCRIFQLPHDVLYDFKLLVQFDEPWTVVPIDQVKKIVRNPWDITIEFLAKTNRDIAENCELVTAALLNEFKEVVGFKDLNTNFQPRDIFKSLTYSLGINHNCERQKQYA